MTDLVTNAKQATDNQRGPIEVAVDAINIGLDFKRAYPGAQPGRYARIAVSDTGMDILDENSEKICKLHFLLVDDELAIAEM